MSSSSPQDYFALVHETLNEHIQRMNLTAAMMLLSQPSVHMDSRFWASPSLDAGKVAGAVILHSIMSTPSSPESQVVDIDGHVVDSLTPSDILILLRCAGGEGSSLVSRVLQQLEDMRRPSANRDRSITVPLGTQAVTPPHKVQEEPIDLAELASVLISGGAASTLPLSQGVLRPSVDTPATPSRKRERSEEVQQPLQPITRAEVPVRADDPLARPGTVFVSRTLEEYDACLKPQKLRSATMAPTEKRRRTAFSAAEDEAIVSGVGRFPAVPGRFSQIFSAYRDVWAPGRTPQHLFDHWRATLRTTTMNIVQ